MLNVCQHPLLQHNLSIARNKNSNPEIFRAAMRRLAQIVLWEATKSLPLSTISIQTPLTEIQSAVLDWQCPIISIPILRAGLMMSEVMLELIPSSTTYHIGIFRDESTKEPITYYNKLAGLQNLTETRVFILDPLLATGGSVLATIQILLKLGLLEKNISVACILASPGGVKRVLETHAQISIYAGARDEGLNEKAYIVPGLGDAGDRAFGTFSEFF